MRFLIITFLLAFSQVTLGQAEIQSVKKDSVESPEKNGIPQINPKGVIVNDRRDHKKKQKKIEHAPRIQTNSVEEVQLGTPTPALTETAKLNYVLSRLRASNQATQRTPTAQQQFEMDASVEYLERTAPNSFSYNYFKYTSGNHDVSRISNLKIAEELDPNNSDVQVQMAGYNMIVENDDKASEYLTKLLTSGRITDNTVEYAEDLLLSVPENGTLITHGVDDSYGTWYLYKTQKVRSDLELISLDFLQSEKYREKLKNKGYQLPASERIDVAYLKEFCRLNSSKRIAISLTTPKEYFKPILNNVYLTGLVFEYHENSVDNFERNEELWNSKLKKELLEGEIDQNGQKLISNYLPMLLQMRKVYGQQGRADKVKEMDTAIDEIGKKCNKTEQVKKLKKSY